MQTICACTNPAFQILILNFSFYHASHRSRIKRVLFPALAAFDFSERVDDFETEFSQLRVTTGCVASFRSWQKHVRTSTLSLFHAQVAHCVRKRTFHARRTRYFEASCIPHRTGHTHASINTARTGTVLSRRACLD